MSAGSFWQKILQQYAFKVPAFRCVQCLDLYNSFFHSNEWLHIYKHTRLCAKSADVDGLDYYSAVFRCTLNYAQCASKHSIFSACVNQSLKNHCPSSIRSGIYDVFSESGPKMQRAGLLVYSVYSGQGKRSPYGEGGAPLEYNRAAGVIPTS